MSEGGAVHLDEVRLDSSTALMVVDVQNDFAHPKGNLYVPGGDEVVPLINGLAVRARDRSAPVVYTQDWHPPSTPHFDTDGGPWPVHCVKETWGAELEGRLEIAGPTVRKGTSGADGYSGFSERDPEDGSERSTGLDDLLHQRGVGRLLVVGLALDVCVKETVLDACRLGYRAEVFADASRPVNRRPGDGARAVAAMVEAGARIV